MVGDGEEGRTLEALCQELRLDGRVTFRGRIDNKNIATIYEQLDVLVVPSVWPENSPVTIAEAMASGIPVIASDIGGISELVGKGVTGLLAPSRDPRALADSIERLRKDPGLRRQMGRNAQAKMRDEGLRGQVTRLLQLFEQLSSEGKRKRSIEPDIVLYTNNTDNKGAS